MMRRPEDGTYAGEEAMRTGGRVVLAAAIFVSVLALPGQAFAAIKITKIYFDSPGSDAGSNASLNAEYVVLKNTGNERVQIQGWKIRDIAGHVYRFPSTKLGAGKSVTLHTGPGSDRVGHRYWDQGWYIWNNDGDKATLKRPGGSTADSCSYSGAGSYVLC
jgi:hypothetical protein